MDMSRPTDQTILVTGGAGFIGSHLAAALVDDNDVRIFDSLTSGARTNIPAGATLIEGDIRNSESLARAIEGVDLIFHKAALVSVQRSIEMPLTSHDVNVTATLELLEAARNENARVVLASSAAIYGQPTQLPIEEEDPKTPTSPYGLEKLTIDHYARQYHDLYGLDTVVLRYFNAYGPRQTASDYSGVISIFLQQARNDEPLTIHGDGKQTRDFVFVDDIVHANLLAAETDTTGDAYNIGTGHSVTIRELAETVIEITDSSSEIVYSDDRDGDIRHSKPAIEKAEDELGYEPRVSLTEGLEQTTNHL